MLRTGERCYAWCSAKMEACEYLGEQFGNCIYRRPDGRLVATTIITRLPRHGCGWDDMKYLGKVVGPWFGGLVKVNKPAPQFIEPPRDAFHATTQSALLYAAMVKQPSVPLLVFCSS